MTEFNVPLLDPAERRAEQEFFPIQIAPGKYVIGQKVDMMMMVFQGTLPMPLLTAMSKMIEMPDASPLDRLSAMDEGDKNELVTLMRRHAVDAVVQPVVTLVDDGDPTHLPVQKLHLSELMEIWNATAMMPMVTPPQAATFRPRASTVSPVAVPPRERIPPRAQPVDTADVERRHA